MLEMPFNSVRRFVLSWPWIFGSFIGFTRHFRWQLVVARCLTATAATPKTAAARHSAAESPSSAAAKNRGNLPARRTVVAVDSTDSMQQTDGDDTIASSDSSVSVEQQQKEQQLKPEPQHQFVVMMKGAPEVILRFLFTRVSLPQIEKLTSIYSIEL